MELDIVIPYVNDFTWQNNELIYTLRSINKYVKNIKDVYIICNKETFKVLDKKLTNIKYLILEDVFVSKSQDIATKLLFYVSNINKDNFVYFNDDYFVTKELDLNNIKNYYDKNLIDKNANALYTEYINTTLRYLSVNNLKSIKNFDIHYPIILNGNNFINFYMDVYLKQTNLKCLVKTTYIYYNQIIQNIEEKKDIKIYQNISKKQLEEVLINEDLFSISPSCLIEENSGIKEYLKENYKKSKYEK